MSATKRISGNYTIQSIGAADTINVSSNLVTITGNLSITNVVQLANLSQTQIAAITSPANGMMAYNYTYGNVVAYTSRLARWGNVVIT